MSKDFFIRNEGVYTPERLYYTMPYYTMPASPESFPDTLMYTSNNIAIGYAALVNPLPYNSLDITKYIYGDWDTPPEVNEMEQYFYPGSIK